MKVHIAIAIQDTNRFFVQGLQHIFQTHFQAKGWIVDFVSVVLKGRVDLVIQPEPLYLLEGSVLGRLGRLTVRYTSGSGQPPLNEVRVLGRRSSPADVIGLVEEILREDGDWIFLNRQRYHQYSSALTSREREVLEGFQRELTPYQIAKKLKLNVKTISAHKIAAMRKLGFRRNNELYHWLLQGGLTAIKERPITSTICPSADR
ncbi:regulatory LuxR family protein [Serratia fonticola]|uniref:Regulatory LuxR family protein n=1 Tax=Serratia fonticola TaxID=47917 RepID=A0A542CY22_SERFO|nr:helix-turn-helix transcriptional regulator [Serratia fonticola]TQI82259.1 regulatory LuxR family protein [Serratia fonticola]TQI95721.1 regulatory LuxR family protein [Serratia fonticola]TVZ70216.1 regulatory LuxR family protein [Serratia fonticola]